MTKNHARSTISTWWQHELPPRIDKKQWKQNIHARDWQEDDVHPQIHKQLQPKTPTAAAAASYSELHQVGNHESSAAQPVVWKECNAHVPQ